jgi:hypothetical protein
MERAVTLSEALEARGFGAPAGVARRRARVGLLPAAIALLAGLVALGMGRMWLGLGSTAIALALALVSTSPAAGRTRLRGVAWDVPSIVVVAGAAAALLGLLAYGLFGGASLSWDPFPRLTAPAFEPFVGATLLGLLAPVLATEVRR